VKCSFCECIEPGEQLPQGWKACGAVVVCQECGRQRYRPRSIQMALVEPIGAKTRDFNLALDKAWNQRAPLHIRDGKWQLAIAAGRRLVRVSIGNRWWTLPLKSSKWSRGRRVTYDSIVSGKAATGELVLYLRLPSGRSGETQRASDQWLAAQAVCKTVAWLPRQDPDDKAGHQGVLAPRRDRLDPSVRNRNLQELEIGLLREAIRANWVSFPSQVPVFPSCGLRAMQPKLVQLYFVLGWKCAHIASRYGLPATQVRQVLNAWRCRAANAGYIQHIPAAFPTAADSCSTSGLDCAIQPERAPSDARRANPGDNRGDPFKSVHGLIQTELPFRVNRKLSSS
jgi:hypothetical protein